MDMQEEKINDNSEITANSEQLEILKKNFPNCFDKDGNYIAAKMEEIVTGHGLELSKESYSLNWLGKSYARLLANENPLTMLKEDTDHNQKEENEDSQNILIKGDNLEVLKHLKNAYENEIKMIYIDPPYNTGGDGFVYNDDRKFTMEELSQLAGVSLEEAKRILEFTESNSNSHSAWLTFMYPRLYIAKELLNNDGVIFISIDDNEVSQLRLLCHEVFGEENELGPIIHNKLNSKSDSSSVQRNHEYLICYRKSSNTDKKSTLVKSEIKIKEAFKDGKRFYILKDSITTRGEGGTLNKRKNLGYSVYYNPDTKDFVGVADYDIELALTSNDESEVYNDDQVLISKGYIKIRPPKVRGKLGAWTWERNEFNSRKDEILIKKKSDGYSVRKRAFVDPSNVKESNGRYCTSVKIDGNSRSIIDYSTNEGTTQLTEIMGKADLFSNPKNINLLQYVFSLYPANDFTFLDFFAGSGSSLHALMKLNSIDRGTRKFIGVQLDEKPKKDSTAAIEGYETIFEITKERTINAANQIKKEKTDYQGDLGLKVYETISLLNNSLTNMDKFDDSEATLFDPTTLNQDDFNALLTTWKVHDGMKLNVKLKEIPFKEYKAYYGDKKLYFLHSGFTTEDLKKFIEKLDNDKTFEPNKLILFGYTFDSKYQREISEALNTYSNKKSIEIDMVVRY